VTVSVGIPSRFHEPSETAHSLRGYDELITVVNEFGIPVAFNQILRASSCDYTVIWADDCTLVEGEVRDLCDPRGVSVPKVRQVNAESIKWNPVVCFPRWVVQLVGYYDEQFGPAYFEDDDMMMRLRVWCVPVVGKPEVLVSHTNPGQTITRLYDEGKGKPNAANNPTYQESQRRFRVKWGLENAGGLDYIL